jgi:hypothetical protein
LKKTAFTQQFNWCRNNNLNQSCSDRKSVV